MEAGITAEDQDADKRNTDPWRMKDVQQNTRIPQTKVLHLHTESFNISRGEASAATERWTLVCVWRSLGGGEMVLSCLMHNSYKAVLLQRTMLFATSKLSLWPWSAGKESTTWGCKFFQKKNTWIEPVWLHPSIHADTTFPSKLKNFMNDILVPVLDSCMILANVIVQCHVICFWLLLCYPAVWILVLVIVGYCSCSTLYSYSVSPQSMCSELNSRSLSLCDLICSALTAGIATVPNVII